MPSVSHGDQSAPFRWRSTAAMSPLTRRPRVVDRKGKMTRTEREGRTPPLLELEDNGQERQRGLPEGRPDHLNLRASSDASVFMLATGKAPGASAEASARRERRPSGNTGTRANTTTTAKHPGSE
ncbi:protein of unknown function [Cyanobium sp. NIES-981]|nr:protein of unknown function [Cyanobium sp. NIES-981]